MSAYSFSELQAMAQESPVHVNDKPETKDVPEGVYNVQALVAKHGYTRTGRDKFVVTLIVLDGPYEGMPIIWHLVIVKEYPELLHKFFTGMRVLGVDQMTFATAGCFDDIVRKIICTAAELKIQLKRDEKGFLDVVWARAL
jgi:hypothetical protein